MLIHTVHCTDSTCRIHSTPDFQAAMSKHFPPLFIPTLDALDLFIAKEATRGFVDHDNPVTFDENDSPAARNEIGAKDDGIRPLYVGEKAGKNARAALWQVTLSWRALSAALGVSEEVMRGDKPGDRETGFGPASADGKKGNVCWWSKCDTKLKDDDVPYKRCSGCHSVTYAITYFGFGPS